MKTEQELYDELSFYTLAHADPAFIHQHIVDAFAAQTAGELTKPIKLTFALVGLYLHVEKQFSGRQVQLVHMQLAQKKSEWPALRLPKERGVIRVVDVLAAPEGSERDALIHAWCAAVWDAFSINRPTITNLLGKYKIF
jgi:hypothetical protein